MVSAKAEVEAAAAWAAKCAEQKQRYPSRKLCYHDNVSLALQVPQAVQLAKQEPETATRSSCAL